MIKKLITLLLVLIAFNTCAMETHTFSIEQEDQPSESATTTGKEAALALASLKEKPHASKKHPRSESGEIKISHKKTATAKQNKRYCTYSNCPFWTEVPYSYERDPLIEHIISEHR